MPVMIYNGGVLIVGGAVAMSEACCCNPPIDCETTQGPVAIPRVIKLTVLELDDSAECAFPPPPPPPCPDCNECWKIGVAQDLTYDEGSGVWKIVPYSITQYDSLGVPLPCGLSGFDWQCSDGYVTFSGPYGGASGYPLPGGTFSPLNLEYEFVAEARVPCATITLPSRVKFRISE